MENYLIHVKNPLYRNAISKLRCSSHSLQIEKGRHTKPKTPIDRRICEACCVVEDEIHFITECARFKCDRNILYQKVTSIDQRFADLSNREKFIYLFRSPDPIILSHLGKYIHESLLKRDMVWNWTFEWHPLDLPPGAHLTYHSYMTWTGPLRSLWAFGCHSDVQNQTFSLSQCFKLEVSLNM